MADNFGNMTITAANCTLFLTVPGLYDSPVQIEGFSTDAMVSLKQLKADYPSVTTMGNLSTYLLELGTPEQVAVQTARLVADGVDIISPACGLSTSTSLKLIRAMTEAVKEG